MRILVCGDRNWTDYDFLALKLSQRLIGSRPDASLNFLTIIEGNAKGVDQMAGKWAEAWGIDLKVFPALWRRYGRIAGRIRNNQMLAEGKPDLVIAFHDDLENSRGTKDMVRRAKKAGIPVEVITH